MFVSCEYKKTNTIVSAKQNQENIKTKEKKEYERIKKSLEKHKSLFVFFRCPLQALRIDRFVVIRAILCFFRIFGNNFL